MQAGNFVYIVTSGPFQGVQGQDYIVRMLIHWETLFSDISFKESLLYCDLSHGTLSYLLQGTSPFKWATKFNLVSNIYYCPLPLTTLLVCSLDYRLPLHI